jgi:hypothetical protein
MGSTINLEIEKADRFGPARATPYLLWSREQADKYRELSAPPQLAKNEINEDDFEQDTPDNRARLDAKANH